MRLIYTFLYFCLILCMSSQAQQNFAYPIVKGNIGELGEADSVERVIQQSHEEARCTIEEIYTAFLSLRDTSQYPTFAEGWNAHPDFPLWLGSCQGGLTPEDFAFELEVENRIVQLREWLQNHEITYKVRVGALSFCQLSHSTAYTSQLSRKKTINLCPYWFRCRSKQKAATIIHELVHKMGFGHPEGTVGPKDAILLARLNPNKACKSPENYEGLAESFYCPLYEP